MPAPPRAPEALALIRLRACIDAGMREGLSVTDLLAMADRALLGELTALDNNILSALDDADLLTIKMTATGFITAYTEPYRAVAAIMRTAHTSTCTVMFKRATDSMRDVTLIPRDRLQALPDVGELAQLAAKSKGRCYKNKLARRKSV